MKKLILLAFVCTAFAFGTQAQRYAVIDSKYILEEIAGV